MDPMHHDDDGGGVGAAPPRQARLAWGAGCPVAAAGGLDGCDQVDLCDWSSLCASVAGVRP